MKAADLLEFMRGRRSLRRYHSEPVPRELINYMLEAAIWAPSAHNRQPWRFVIIDEDATKARLAREMGRRCGAIWQPTGCNRNLLKRTRGVLTSESRRRRCSSCFA